VDGRGEAGMNGIVMERKRKVRESSIGWMEGPMGM
jgi:hypothetical protein